MTLLVSVTAIVLVLASGFSPAFGQGINIDATSLSTGGQITTDSWSHTVSSTESNLILIVGVAHIDSPPSVQVNSVTYGRLCTDYGIGFAPSLLESIDARQAAFGSMPSGNAANFANPCLTRFWLISPV